MEKNVSGSAPVFRNYRIKGDKMELDFGQKQDGFQIKGTTLKRLYHCRAGPCVLSGRGDGPEWENYSFFLLKFLSLLLHVMAGRIIRIVICTERTASRLLLSGPTVGRGRKS